jgi:hypothetical protein
MSAALPHFNACNMPAEIQGAWAELIEQAGCHARNRVNTGSWSSDVPAVCGRNGYVSIRGLGVCHQHEEALGGDSGTWLRVMIGVEVVDAGALNHQYTQLRSHSAWASAAVALRETSALHDEPEKSVRAEHGYEMRDLSFRIIGERWLVEGDEDHVISTGDRVFCDLYAAVEDAYQLGLTAAREMDIPPARDVEAVVALLAGTSARRFPEYGVRGLGVVTERLEPGDRPRRRWYDGEPRAAERERQLIVPDEMLDALAQTTPSLDEARAAAPVEASAAARAGVDDSGYGIIFDKYFGEEARELEGALDVALASADCPDQLRIGIVRFLASKLAHGTQESAAPKVFSEQTEATLTRFLERFELAAASQRGEEHRAARLEERRAALERAAQRILESGAEIEIAVGDAGKLIGKLTVDYRRCRHDAEATLSFSADDNEIRADQLEIVRSDRKKIHHKTSDGIEGALVQAATAFVRAHPELSPRAAFELEQADISRELAEIEASAAKLRERSAEIDASLEQA